MTMISVDESALATSGLAAEVSSRSERLATTQLLVATHKATNHIRNRLFGQHSWPRAEKRDSPVNHVRLGYKRDLESRD
jgi:hypothetical protein